MTLEILAVQGIPEVLPGDDLAALIAAHAPDLRDGDVIVVTSKIVSKAEGQQLDVEREAAIDAETVRVVARRADTRIVQTRHGFVMAAAGVDASNVTKGSVVVLPVDSDASARRIREGVRERLGVNVGVVVSDTFGRPWRVGVTDVAIGVAGITPLDDLRGTVDPYGNELQVTLTCTVDEIAAAADLVKGKLNGVPAAIVRGLAVVHEVGENPTGQRDFAGRAERRRRHVLARHPRRAARAGRCHAIHRRRRRRRAGATRHRNRRDRSAAPGLAAAAFRDRRVSRGQSTRGQRTHGRRTRGRLPSTPTS